MPILSIDIETYSDVDLSKCGVYAYSDSPNFEILLFAAVVWGFFNEDRLAAFEKRVICAVRRKKLRVLKGGVNSRCAEYMR